MWQYLKLIFSEKKTIFLMLAGLIATVVSFAYPKVTVHGNFIIALSIVISDAVLLFVNARTVSSLWTREKENRKMLDNINAILITVMYFCIFVILSGMFWESDLTMEKITGALGLALGLGPSLLIVLPILYGIIYILGN